MAATQIGTTLIIGQQTTVFGSYIVTDQTDNQNEAGTEDTFDADGALANRTVFYRWPKINFNLIGKSGAAPETDFPPNAKCTATGTYSGWWVEGAPVTKSKSPLKIAVTLVSIGIT
jgi:hypothetical protein